MLLNTVGIFTFRWGGRHCFDTTRKLKSELETLQSEIAKDPKLKSEQDVQIEDYLELTDKLENFFMGLASEFIDSDMGRREIKPSDPEYILIEEMLKRFAK